ncbi:MAG: flagellar hook-basal body complex protein [Caldimicrobium sp.]|nr:flagellar hook-basal body complex protein [Caldimicrobium sp.]
MGLFGTMFIGYSGLYSDSIATKVSADNITNLNTVGFKGSRTEFANELVRAQEVFARERGYGTNIKAIRTIFTQGSLQTTDVPTDLAIIGKGFFVVQDAKGNEFFTRDGQFFINEADEQHYTLQNALGMSLLGADPDAREADLATLRPQLIPKIMPAKGTSYIKAELLLDSRKPLNVETLVSKYDAGVNPTKPLPDGKYDWVFEWQIYDTSGEIIPVKLYVDRGSTPNTYEVLFTLSDPSKDGRGEGKMKGAFLYGEITFGSSGEVIHSSFYDVALDGTITSQNISQLGKPRATLNIGGTTQEITLDFGFTVNPDNSITREVGSLKMMASPFTQLGFNQDGYPLGVFDRLEVINEEGQIRAWYTNQKDIAVARIFLADFAGYEEALDKIGNGLFRARPGVTAFLFAPSSAERGRILSGALEGSNVDLAMEMVNLIVLQRSFQSNSRVITTADGMLEDFLRQR